MFLEKLIKTKTITPPPWMYTNIHYVVDAGSRAYNTFNEFSDYDIFGFCTTPKVMSFPWLEGFIPGFATPPPSFDRFHQQCSFEDKDYDIQILGLIHCFNLLFKNSPDQIDLLWVRVENIRHITSTGQMVRDNRHKFLSKNVFHRYRGYAYAQFNKSENEKAVGKRKDIRDKFGYDATFLSHAVRLVYECEQLLNEGELDLHKCRDHVLAVKNGIIGLEDTKKWFNEYDSILRKSYENTKLPHSPPEDELKVLLLDCLENHYGSLAKAIEMPGREVDLLRKIHEMTANI
jgi:predicted nucleotidyltransferase